MRDGPQGRRRGGAVRKRFSERAVEDDRRDRAQSRIRFGRLGERRGEFKASTACRGPQRLELGVLEHAGGFDEARVDLGLGQGTRGRRQERSAEMEHVARKLEVEEGGFVLLELRRRRQHVVGQPGGLGHEHVDGHDNIQRRNRFAHPLTVRQ